ncbi:MAG: NAD-dependent epimerase/dehydratase family protein [Actinomycetota bacterium]|nr:NAD-dependent epimerase/dehydratase family protein [Actinomycetota bacterium]
MRVLLTGGNGFIGSHVAEALVAGGTEVLIVDRNGAWPTGSPPDGVEILPGDIRDPVICATAVAGVDAVCHQAAKVGLGVDFADVTGYVEDNDVGTATLLAALWDRSFRGRMVLAASMVVYGEGRYRCERHGIVPAGRRRFEDLVAGRFEPRCPMVGCGRSLLWRAVPEDAPTDPRNVYAATKLHQEHLCALWAGEAGATAVALRYHNVYGPRLPRDTPYAGVAAIFKTAVEAGRAPQVHEDGRQMRDFVHVRDVARANVTALFAPDVASGAYNIASGEPHSVGDMAVAISSAVAASATSEPLAPEITGQWRVGDVRHIVASADKADRGLGFQAEIRFEEGMNELAGPETAPR